MTNKVSLYLLLTCLILSQSQSKESRNFVEWMSDVEDSAGRKGIKALVLNINPSMSQEDADAYAIQITEAAEKFPDFCNTGNDDRDKAEFAAFLTIVGAETSFSTAGGFPCTKENGCPNCLPCSYNSKGIQCEADPNLQYFGRGPLQLSWDYNYEEFSEYYFGDEHYLLDNPNLLTVSGARCWASAIWFWMVKHGFGGWCMPPQAWAEYETCNEMCPDGPNGCEISGCSNSHWLNRGRASCHDAIQGETSTSGGLGEVLNIINGGYDCCPSSTYGARYGHVEHRFWWYLDIYRTWTGTYPEESINPVPVHNCPLAVGVNCERMTGVCWSNCCSLKPQYPWSKYVDL